MNFAKLLVSSLLVASTSLHAQADNIGWGTGREPGRGPGHQQPTRPTQPQQPRDPWSDQRDDQYQNVRDVELQVNQYFQGQARFDLLADQYTRSQLQGKRIKEIIITASTEAGNGQARLLVNGQALDQAQTVARQMARYTFRVDPFANTLGQSLRNLEMELRGKFYVEKVAFALIKNNGPSDPSTGYPPGSQLEVIRQQLNETIQGEGGLHLFRMFNLAGERQGQVIKRVTISARSQRGSGQAQLQVNDSSTTIAQNIGAYSTRLTFELSPNARIGQEIQNLRLIFRGSIVVEEVSIEIEKRGGGYPPAQRRIDQMVNRRVMETDGVSFSSLIRMEYGDENRMVESVELYLRNSDYGSRVKLCQQYFGQYQSVVCANPTILNQGSQVVRLSLQEATRLSQLSLSVRMGMIDIDRIVINLR